MTGSSDNPVPSASSGNNVENLERLYTLAYEEAVRGFEAQRTALGELRSRTGLIISAASISTSFLGSAAATGHGGFPLRFLWAVIPFAVSLAIAIFILNPRRNWALQLDARAFGALADRQYASSLDQLASMKSSSIDTNQRKLDVMSYLFAASSTALLWSIIAWVVVIE